MSHQIFDGVSMHFVSVSCSTNLSYDLAESNFSGIPVLGKSSNTMPRYDLNPVSSPCQNGDEVDKLKICGTKYLI